VTGAQLLAAASAVGLIVLFVVRRRKLTRAARAVLVVLVAGFATYAVLPESALPDVEALIADATAALGPWTYLLAFTLVYLETAAATGLVSPGEAVLVFAGAAAAEGQVELVPVIALTIVAAVTGDLTGYALGRWKGRPLLLAMGGAFGVTEPVIDRSEARLRRIGAFAPFVARWIGVLRAVAPMLFGEARVPLRAFVPASAAGAVLWCVLFVLLGHAFSRSLQDVLDNAGLVVFALGTVAVVVAGAVVLRRRLRRA